VGQGADGVFPMPAVWVTPGTGHYFAELPWNQGEPPSGALAGLGWLLRERAETRIRASGNTTSRARDLGLLESVADIFPLLTGRYRTWYEKLILWALEDCNDTI
jgi:hypothetical protein